jgi:hypothetical protein
MSTDQTGGAPGAGAVRACLSWAWWRLCWFWCCPGAIASCIYFTAAGDSSPSCLLPFPHVLPCCAPPAHLAIIQSDGSGRGVSCFASLFAGLIGFSLAYPLFLRDIPLIFALIVCYSVLAYPFYCLIIYSIAARLMPGRAPLCVLIAGFSPGRVVRCYMSAFSLACARI